VGRAAGGAASGAAALHPPARKKKGLGALGGVSPSSSEAEASPKGPPRSVRKDTEFEVTIERDANGLGIEVDSVGGAAVIGAVAARGAAARQSAVLAGDRIVRVFEYETPTYKEASLLYYIGAYYSISLHIVRAASRTCREGGRTSVLTIAHHREE